LKWATDHDQGLVSAFVKGEGMERHVGKYTLDLTNLEPETFTQKFSTLHLDH